MFPTNQTDTAAKMDSSLPFFSGSANFDVYFSSLLNSILVSVAALE